MLHGYQVEALTKIMYAIHKAVEHQNWEELQKIVSVKCSIDEIIMQIDEYPGKITDCNIRKFFEKIMFEENLNSHVVDAMAQFWVDGEESDLSMECRFRFEGKKIKMATLECVHVF